MLWTLLTLFFLSLCGTLSNYLTVLTEARSTYTLTEFFTILARHTPAAGGASSSVLIFQALGSLVMAVQTQCFMLLTSVADYFDRELRVIQDFSDIFFYLDLYGFDILYISEPVVWVVLFFILFIIPVFIIIAYSTLLERKLMGSIQRRQGPNVVGFKGLLQPLADGLKLLIKEFFWPKRSYFGIYFFAAGLGLIISLYLWFFLPLNAYPTINLPILLLFILAIQIVETYSLILAGWASNSKYALLGALRTTAQMISYELALSFIILTIVSITGSLDLVEIVLFQANSIWFVFPLFPLFGLFLCASLAETNRTPFDLPEAEAELVAGYNVEYSGMLFALFFLAEYANMAFLSTLISLFFLGGWHVPGLLIVSPYLQSFVLGLKTTSILFFFVWIRATLPRYRYDQLMDLGWKVFLPFTFSFFLFVMVLLYCFGALPIQLLAFMFLI